MWRLCSDSAEWFISFAEKASGLPGQQLPPPQPLWPQPLLAPPHSPWLNWAVDSMSFWGRAFAQAVPSLESSTSQTHSANPSLLQALSGLAGAPPWPPSPFPSPSPTFSFLHCAHRFIAHKVYNLLVHYYPSPSKKLKALRRQKSLFLFADVS